MDDSIREIVRRRAGDRCEYCRLPQGVCPMLTFHVDHIFAKQHLVPLYHPRNDQWNHHFLLHGGEIEGISPTGRATVRLLNMNAPQRVELREQWIFDGGRV